MTPLDWVLIVVAVVMFARAELSGWLADRQRGRDNARWTEILNNVEQGHVEELKRLANVKLTGTTEIPAAVRVPAPDDAAARANREANELWISNGMKALATNYRDANLPVPSEEELREQAERMLRGQSPI